MQKLTLCITGILKMFWDEDCCCALERPFVKNRGLLCTYVSAFTEPKNWPFNYPVDYSIWSALQHWP